MKKSFKTLGLGLLTIGMLAGCKPAAAPNWSSQQIKDMEDNLYGYVLPYISAGLEVSVKDGMVSVSGGTVKDGDLEKLADIFKDAGWSDLTVYPDAGGDDQVSNLDDGSQAAAAAPDYYEFEKGFEVENKTRYVNVSFEASEVANPDDDQDAEPTYEWSILAGDPYLYAFPGEQIAADLHSSLGASVGFPDPVADHYFYYYHSDAQTQRFSLFLRAYLPKGETSDLAGYGAKLTAAGFGTPKQETDEDENVYFVSGSPDDSYCVNYSYNDARGCLEIEPGNFEGWPGNSVQAWLTSKGYTDTMPAYPLNNIGSSFNFALPQPGQEDYDDFYAGYEYEVQFIATTGTGAAAMNSFMSYLKDECNFTGNGSSVYASPVLASPNKQFMARFMSMDSYVFIDFGPYVEAISTWARVQELYSPLHAKEGATTMLPAFTGAAYFGVSPNEVTDAQKQEGYVSSTYITVETEVAGAMASYAAALVDAGILKGEYNDNYYDPLGKFYIKLEAEEDSENFTIKVIYSPSDCDFSFPGAEFKAALVEANAAFAGLTIPASNRFEFRGVSWYLAGSYVLGIGVPAASLDGFVALIVGIFTSDGWTADESYPNYYNSADGTYWVLIRSVQGYVQIAFGINS